MKNGKQHNKKHPYMKTNTLTSAQQQSTQDVNSLIEREPVEVLLWMVIGSLDHHRSCPIERSPVVCTTVLECYIYIELYIITNPYTEQNRCGTKQAYILHHRW